MSAAYFGRDPVAEADPGIQIISAPVISKEELFMITSRTEEAEMTNSGLHPECLLDLCLIHRDASIELPRRQLFVTLVMVFRDPHTEQIKDIRSRSDASDLLILQVHLFIVFQLIVHHLSDEIGTPPSY